MRNMFVSTKGEILMKAIAVHCIPERMHGNHKLRRFFEDFITSNIKLAKIELSEVEYKSPKVAQNVMGIAARRGKYPVKVMLRGDDIYLQRTDM
jgi:hypothetical protein